MVDCGPSGDAVPYGDMLLSQTFPCFFYYRSGLSPFLCTSELDIYIYIDKPVFISKIIYRTNVRLCLRNNMKQEDKSNGKQFHYK